jgi:hypothetical protein
MPTPLVRLRKISLRSSSASYWVTRSGISLQKARSFSAKPTGMSSITPPTWK